MQWFKIPAKTYLSNAVKYLRDMYGIGGRHRVRQGHGAAGVVDKIIDRCAHVPTA